MTRKPTPRKTIRKSEIETMKIDAAAAGDFEQVAVCELALAGNHEAITECVRVMNDAVAAGWAPFDWGRPIRSGSSEERDNFADLYGEGAMLARYGHG